MRIYNELGKIPYKTSFTTGIIQEMDPSKEES